jgi:hypothetical protein
MIIVRPLLVQQRVQIALSMLIKAASSKTTATN